MPIPDFQTYGELIYSLQERDSSIQRSTLVLATIGPTLAQIEGQITFALCPKVGVCYKHSAKQFHYCVTE